jgi:DNA-binding NarL/FixJ family response regulator
VQISPLSPTPPLRSGSLRPTPRSDSASQPVRVRIGDGDGEVRRALRASFAADSRLEVVGEADDGALALQLIRWLRPDVALLDEDMPCFGGAAIARILKSELSEVRVVVMTRTVTRAGL